MKSHILKSLNKQKSLLPPRLTKFQDSDFTFLKGGKLWAKLEMRNGKDFLARFWKKRGNFKSRFEPCVGDLMTGKVVVVLKQIFIGKRVAITCLAQEALISEIEEPPSLFEEEEEDHSDSESDFELERPIGMMK